MPLIIDYRLTGTGWARCEVSDGTASSVITASYLSDALGDLVLAATSVVAGFRRVSFGFDEEPGEYRWILTRQFRELELKILGFEVFAANNVESEGRLVFQTICDPREFGEAVRTAAKRVLAAAGEKGYFELWARYPFPAAQLRELDRLLAKP